MYNEILAFIRSQFPGQDFIPLHEPVFSGKEREYVLDAIESTYVSSVGKYVNQFEYMMQEITWAKYAVATVNGTSALHAALLVAGVKSGTEVITQPITFVATPNAITYCGAEPVFIDVDLDTLGMSPESLQRFFSEHTELKGNRCINKLSGRAISACVPVHIFGHPCRIDQIVSICENYHVPVVEDAAESIGSYYKGKHTGTFGNLGIFSFNGNKTITCGGGGCIVTNDQKYGEFAKHLTTTGKIPHPYEYVHDIVAYNYRMPNLNAAVACAQLEQLPDILRSKRILAQEYRSFFSGLDISFFTEPENAKSNYWLNTILLEDTEARDTFLTISNISGVMTRPIWRLMNRLEMFKGCLNDGLSNSRWLEDRIVNIPSSHRA
jgi:perosamine synthetase